MRNKQVFPDVECFSRVSGFVPYRTKPGGQALSLYVSHAALKVHGRTKRRILRGSLRDALPSSVKVDVRGLAGWDRLCKRIFAEAIGGHSFELVERDTLAYAKLFHNFQENADRKRRPLETYMEVKRCVRKDKKRGGAKTEGQREDKKPPDERGYLPL